GRTVGSFRQRDVPLAGADPHPQEGSVLPDAAALAASGRRIAVGAIAVAVLVPAAVPGLQPRGMFGIGGEGGGTRTVTTPDPLVSLKRELTRQDDSEVLTYRTNDSEAPDYLRLYALDKFEGDRWTYSQLDSRVSDRLDERDIPPPPGLSIASSREVTTRVEVRPEVRDMSFLPVPYAPSKVSISGDWRVDERSLMIYSLRDSADGRAYTVTSRRAEPTTAELASSKSYPAEIVSRYGAVPKNIPKEVRALAEQVTDGASTALGQAVRLQRWFTLTGGFVYDLNAQPPKHGSDLVDFLLHSKRGYCEQYAASMALMARILNIPSRVAMGYTSGSEVKPGEYVVRSKDAHAWPELYFDGTGWVRFEPTPAGVGGQGTAATPEYSLPAVTGGGGEGGESETAPEATSPTDEKSPAPEPSARHRNDREETGGAAAQDDEDGGFSATPWVSGGVLVMLLLAVPMALRTLTRRRRWAALISPPASPSGSSPRKRPGSPGGAGARAQ
ncbi:MAG: transglutaminaseTgpA domain-containing protein, partial [Spirillospora sp.]